MYSSKCSGSAQCMETAGTYTVTFTTDSARWFYNYVSSFVLDGNGTEVVPMNASLDLSNGTASVTEVVMSDGTVLTADEIKAKGATITYASSDATKATVDAATGAITDVAEGKTTITATVMLNGVVVFGGVNDFGSGDTPIGEFSDRTPETFYGTCHDLYAKLIEKYPGKVIVIMTPLHFVEEDEVKIKHGTKVTLKTYVDIIREVAEYSR